MARRFLAVQDDEKVAVRLERRPVSRPYGAAIGHTGGKGSFLAVREKLDLIILGLAHPGRAGTLTIVLPLEQHLPVEGKPRKGRLTMIRHVARQTMAFGTGLAAMVAFAGPAYAGAPGQAPKAQSTVIRMTFDALQPGSLPTGWKIEATHPGRALAAWKVTADRSAPSPPNVLRAVPPSNSRGGTYNLCWTRSITFLDGEITVHVRGDAGRGDQGGGPMWRVRDRNNYDVARYNPLEHNFRMYTVKNGVRRMIAGASRITIPTGRWFTIRIVQKGDHIEGWLDGKKLLDVHNTTLSNAGGVGLWTKSDAATSFDTFTVRVAGE